MSILSGYKKGQSDKKTPTPPTPATPAGTEISPLKVQRMNDRIEKAKGQPIPHALFASLWREGEVCIFFSTSNLGKSILAVQIAECIASGKSIGGFCTEVPAQKVLYLDFEMSDKQLEKRASEDYQNHYQFADNLYSVKLNDEYILQNESLEQAVLNAIAPTATATGAKIVIVDNLTYLKSDNERARDATVFMQQLKRIKDTHGLSVLILAHTPKRDICQPLTMRDLQGSSALSQFCDSMFTIGGSSKDINLRYVKQIKNRDGEFTHGSDNVIVCEIEKTNFTYFNIIGYSHEREHLQVSSELQDKNIIDSIIATYTENPALSYAQIAAICETNKSKVYRIITAYKAELNTDGGDEFPESFDNWGE